MEINYRNLRAAMPNLMKEPRRPELPKPRDSAEENMEEFVKGSLPVIGTAMNGARTVASLLITAATHGRDTANLGIHALGTLSNIAGTGALAAGLITGMVPVSIAGAALLAGSGLATASS